MRFKLNQEVTPNKSAFRLVAGKPVADELMPKFGKVYTVAIYPFVDDVTHPKHKYLMLSELPYALFHECSFEPLVTSDRLEKDLFEVEAELLCSKVIKQLMDG